MPLSFKPALIVCIGCLAFASLKGQEQNDEAWLEEIGLGSLFEEGDEMSGGELVSETELETELRSLEEELSLLAAMEALTAWSSEATLAAGYGWQDNVLLEPDEGVDSGYWGFEADAYALRPGLGNKLEWFGMLYAEAKRFDAVPDLDEESLLLAQGAVSRLWGNEWRGTLRVEGARTVQAFDESIVESQSDAATIRIWQPSVSGHLERRTESLGTIGLGLKTGASDYDQDGEDYDVFSGQLEWERNWSGIGPISLSLEGFEQRYDQRLERLSVGSLGEDLLLRISGTRVGADWRWAREDGFLRKARTRISLERETDGVGDFYGKESWRVSQSLEAVWGKWEFRLSGSFGEVSYLERPASFAEPEVPRRDEVWRVSAEASREINEAITLFGRADLSDKDSNAGSLTYEGSSVFVGVQFSASLVP